jgi:hypothetical protein
MARRDALRLSVGAATLYLRAGSLSHFGLRLLPNVHGEQTAPESRFARSQTLQSKGLRQPAFRIYGFRSNPKTPTPSVVPT